MVKVRTLSSLKLNGEWQHNMMPVVVIDVWCEGKKRSYIIDMEDDPHQNIYKTSCGYLFKLKGRSWHRVP
jgi:hypothetical protein